MGSSAFDDRYFRKQLTRRQVKSALAMLRRQAVHVAIEARVLGNAPDVEDDLVLLTALDSGAGFVVTNDAAFLALGSHHRR
jgi:predicted nucleic acid-binding protein